MFDWRKYLAERSAMLDRALFDVPFGCSISPALYWSMECHRELLVARKRQYAEEMDRLITQIAPIVALEPRTYVIDRDRVADFMCAEE